MSKNVVTVFGTGRARPGESVFILAEQLGRELAQAGFVIANGGYGGTMLATAKGAVEAGGTVIGVTCSAFGSSVANEYVTREVVTGSLDERLQNLIKAGCAYVVLPGGTGTLLELAAVWELKNKKFLDRRKPIVLLGEFWRPLTELVCQDDPRSVESIVFADSPTQAVALIRQALQK
ncbi:MAG: LOG family protein [Sedimentisphaerales bacterium]|nr:LOG family protein [Sedimentisphaerales bacterium]